MRRRFSKLEREQREARFWQRVWKEHEQRLPPWTIVASLYTQSLPCSAGENKAEWDRVRTEFHRILKGDPDFYSDCL